MRRTLVQLVWRSQAVRVYSDPKILLGVCPTLVAAASYAAKFGAMRWRSYRMLWHINRVYVMSDRLLEPPFPFHREAVR